MANKQTTVNISIKVNGKKAPREMRRLIKLAKKLGKNVEKANKNLAAISGGIVNITIESK